MARRLPAARRRNPGASRRLARGVRRPRRGLVPGLAPLQQARRHPRVAGPVSRVELFGHGRPWLGPDWDSAVDPTVGRARPTLWISHSSADLAEWSFTVGKAKVIRTALLLRGRQLALLAEQWNGP